jgi:uncharacterized protein YegP (UPF0339 family)
VNGHVEIFKGEGRILPGFFYRLVSANGQTLSVSESYVTAWNARRAARKVAESLGVEVRDLTRKPYARFGAGK